MQNQIRAEEKEMKRTMSIVVGVVVLVVLLAGAAFVAGQMWGREAPQDETLAGPPPMVPPEGAPAGERVMVQLESAKELPQRPPDVLGVFARQEDNRIFVNSSGQGVVIIQNGEAVSDAGTKEVEVVVTSETTVYEDVTQQSVGGDLPSGGTVQQKVKPGSVEAVGENSILSAWGEKRGDRLVADFLVYTGPPVINR
jgi:flagellar basal body-associated protein FliL